MGRFHQPDKYPATGAGDAVAIPEDAPLFSAPDPEPPARPARSLPRAAVIEVDGANPLAKVAFVSTLLYIFGIFSLSEELSIHFLGVKPYLTTWAGILAMMAALFSGGFGRIMQFGPFKTLCAMVVWMMACVPFSSWRGGSFDLVSSYITRNLIIAVLLLLTLTTFSQIRLVFYFMTASSLLLTLALRSAQFDMSGSDPRLAFAEGRLANPNDLATHMLVLLPFALGLFFLVSRFSLLRPICLLVSAGCVYTVLQTGSRGALITLVVLGVIVVWKLPNAVHKMALLVAGMLFAAVVVPFLPNTVIQRYKLLLADDSTVPSNMMESQALESSESRRAILIRSIEVTMKHPIFGVGPGEFQNADAGEARAEGRRGTWLQTHNGYTQVSSEAGIPAFLMFATTIFWCLKIASSYHKKLGAFPQLRGERTTALVLFSSMAGFAINICFSSLAFTFYIPSLVGLLGAYVLVADREMAILRKRGKAPARTNMGIFGARQRPATT